MDRGLIRPSTWLQLPCSFQPPFLEAPWLAPKGNTGASAQGQFLYLNLSCLGLTWGVRARAGMQREVGLGRGPRSRGHRVGSRTGTGKDSQEGESGREEREWEHCVACPSSPRVPTPSAVKGHSQFPAEEEGGMRALGLLPGREPAQVWCLLGCLHKKPQRLGLKLFPPSGQCPGSGGGLQSRWPAWAFPPEFRGMGRQGDHTLKSLGLDCPHPGVGPAATGEESQRALAHPASPVRGEGAGEGRALPLLLPLSLLRRVCFCPLLGHLTLLPHG